TPTSMRCYFLSCLGGSARRAIVVVPDLYFLSCLGGSALEITTNNVLIVKELWMKKSDIPLFRAMPLND
ncbi:MAG: hypothetical protein VYB20_02355, partial [Pseudomonadota bacterium]|nr:hypothetical protein [Pseudomonadota bacterium]